MNSKNIILIAILGLLIIGLVVFLFVGEANNKSTVKVGDVDYDINDFESYVKVWNYEDDSSKSDVDAMYQNYMSYKVYYTRADKAGVTLSGDEIPAALESGDEATLLNDYNLTSGEYMRVKTEMAKANKLYASPYELAKIPADYYTQYKDAVLETSPDAFETYDYRVVEIELEPEIEVEDEASGDVVAQASGDVSGEQAKKEEQRKADCKEKTTKVLELVKEYVSSSGDEVKSTIIDTLKQILPEKEDVENPVYNSIFDYISTNTDNTRYTQNTNGFNSVANGELDSASKLYFKEDMTGDSSYLGMFGLTELAKKIVDEVERLKKGEFSDVFETENGYAFIYQEDIRDELSEADETRFNNEIANYYIGQNAKIVVNKVLIKQIDLEQLMPKVARDAEEARKQAELEAASGDNAIASGDTAENSVQIDEIGISGDSGENL